MLKLHPLFSGSSGNMYLIESDNKKILVDFGVSYKAASDALNKINLTISSIDAVLITHEHTDHVKGLERFIKCNPTIPVYATKKTYDELFNKYLHKLDLPPVFCEVKYDENIFIDDIEIFPFKVSHDAAMPVGYMIKSGNNSLTIATDLGYIDTNIYEKLRLSSLSVIEANYDPNLLMYGPYPYSTKMRIQGEYGHLSNVDTSSTILKLAREGKRDFILGHISLNNNSNDQALFEVNNTLSSNGFNLDDFNINVATRDFSNEVYTLC